MTQKDEALDVEHLLRDAELPLPSPYGSQYFKEYKQKYIKFAESYHQAKAALSEPETVTLPDGWIAVPVEPTENMLKAAKLEQADHGSYDEWIYYGYGEDVIANYKAMLQAAPTLNEKG